VVAEEGEEEAMAMVALLFRRFRKWFYEPFVFFFFFWDRCRVAWFGSWWARVPSPHLLNILFTPSNSLTLLHIDYAYCIDAPILFSLLPSTRSMPHLPLWPW
jgi:hypothetical protein